MKESAGEISDARQRWRRIDLAEIVEAPTHDSSIRSQRGRVVTACGNFHGSGKGKRRRALIGSVLAKACDGSVAAEDDAVQFACCDIERVVESNRRRALTVGV